VLAHARALLTSSEAGATEYIHADLRDTETILVQARQLLDFTKPAQSRHAPPRDYSGASSRPVKSHGWGIAQAG
jgi:hypothetical protein